MDKQAEIMLGRKRKRIDGKIMDMILSMSLTMRIDGDDIDLRAIRTCAPPTLNTRQAFRLLLQLDTVVNPGITEDQFKEMFAKCGKCGIITTMRVFRSHQCVRIAQDIIDLTVDDD